MPGGQQLAMGDSQALSGRFTPGAESARDGAFTPGGQEPEGKMETLEDRKKQLVALEERFALQARSRTNEALPGFNADAPPTIMPEYISGSHMAEVLQESENEPKGIDDAPSIYDEYKHSTTRGGVTFGVCIKPGMDLNPALETKLLETESLRFETERVAVGLVAGDDECYEMFHHVFDLVVARCHEGREGPSPAQPIQLEPEKVRETGDVDAGGKFVVHTTVEARRNLATIALGPGANSNDRREVEQLLTSAACGASESDLEDEDDNDGDSPVNPATAEDGLSFPNSGSYYPMPDSWSHGSMQVRSNMITGH